MSEKNFHALYTLQREAKLGTNIYKIGMTEKSLVHRINNEASYRSARIIIARDVSNGSEAESLLKIELNKNGILKCKDEDKQYKGIEDYYIDDLPGFIKIFNDVCDKFMTSSEINRDSTSIPIDQNTKNILSNLGNTIYDLNFMNIISKRKILCELFGKNKNKYLDIISLEFDKIFKPIEIYKGIDYNSRNTYIGYLINIKAMYDIIGIKKEMTLTKFTSEIHKLADYVHEKYKSYIHYNMIDQGSFIKDKTRAKVVLINSSNIKLFMNTSQVINKYFEINPEEFIKTFDVNVLQTLKRYDKEDHELFIDKNMEAYKEKLIKNRKIINLINSQLEENKSINKHIRDSSNENIILPKSHKLSVKKINPFNLPKKQIIKVEESDDESEEIIDDKSKNPFLIKPKIIRGDSLKTEIKTKSGKVKDMVSKIESDGQKENRDDNSNETSIEDDEQRESIQNNKSQLSIIKRSNQKEDITDEISDDDYEMEVIEVFDEIVEEIQNPIIKVIIEFLLNNHYNIVIKDGPYDDIGLNHKNKTLIVSRSLVRHFGDFKILFKYNTNIDYDLIKSLDILTKVNSEDLILYHNYLNDIFRSMLYDETRWDGKSKQPVLYEFLEFMFDKIYKVNNINSTLMANKFKYRYNKVFEQKYKNFAQLDYDIKTTLYKKLDVYIKEHNKLKQGNEIRLDFKF